ncbi:hypothetical protein [Amycolatopsis cihanbeyliensis]|uniref:Uncharacterized protein n=1 Tax=Amycolatopsis cihanbeyliensis TaxID=1128664 RepID=A0A542DNX8_AMYCI|nr:hypothetical protein [Amycolatopsis cihanbeyliensis]TQJ04800.1 hypothetical protein FB471_4609 [Amycolatopsis cihanbeyliensis]
MATLSILELLVTIIGIAAAITVIVLLVRVSRPKPAPFPTENPAYQYPPAGHEGIRRPPY